MGLPFGLNKPESRVIISNKYAGKDFPAKRLEVGSPGGITLRLFHRLREITGEKTVRISPVPESVIGLINRFFELYPDAEDEMLDEDGEFSHRFVVSVNEKMLKRPEWDEVKLADGDEVAFLTLLSGG